MSVKSLVVAVVGALVIGCGGSAGGGGGGGSSTGGGAPAVGGSSSSIPSGLSMCGSASGDVTKISDHDTQGEWQFQQSKNGATGGEIEVYADSAATCVGMPDIRHGAAKILASAVITFKDASSAQKATGGMFAVNPGSNPAAVKGSSSGYGASGVYVYSATEAMVVWTSASKAVAIVGENVGESDFKSYADAVKRQNAPS